MSEVKPLIKRFAEDELMDTVVKLVCELDAWSETVSIRMFRRNRKRKGPKWKKLRSRSSVVIW